MTIKTLCRHYAFQWAKVTVRAMDGELLFQGTIIELYHSIYCNKKIHSFTAEDENTLEIIKL